MGELLALYAALAWPVMPLCHPDGTGACACGHYPLPHAERAVGKAALFSYTDALEHPGGIEALSASLAWRVCSNIGILLELARLLVCELARAIVAEEGINADTNVATA